MFQVIDQVRLFLSLLLQKQRQITYMYNLIISFIMNRYVIATVTVLQCISWNDLSLFVKYGSHHCFLSKETKLEYSRASTFVFCHPVEW